jgi:hypothetical protein
MKAVYLERQHKSVFIALFYISHYTYLNIAYVSLEECDIEPMAEDMFSSQTPDIKHSTTARPTCEKMQSYVGVS